MRDALGSTYPLRVASRITSVARWPFAELAAVACFFLIAAVVQTWPLVLHASDSVVSWPVQAQDTWAHLWNLWWVKRAIVDLQTNPLHTDRLFYPQGADLHLHTLDTVNGVLSIPLQVLTGNVILSWNILALILFALSGLTTYTLSYRLTQSRGAALVSGYIFAFSPFVMMRFGGHWNISTTWTIPLFALFLVRLQDKGRLHDAAGAGVSWALLAYNNQEYAVDAGLFLGLFLAYWSVVHILEKDWTRARLLWRGLVAAAAVYFVLASPLLIPAFLSPQSGVESLPHGDELYSTDLAALVTPSPLWGPGLAPVWPTPPGLHHFPAGDIENTVYLGITPLLLGTVALVAYRRFPRQAVFWGLIFLFFVALALGPHLSIGDSQEFSLAGINFAVPMPYQIYDKIPIISWRRGISRIIVFGILALSLLAGMGARVLLSWLKKYSGKLSLLAGVIVLALVALEFWNPPTNIEWLDTPAIFEEIGREPGDFTVLHVPLGRVTAFQAGTQAGGVLADYYERIYGKPTIGGYLSRGPDSTLRWIEQQPGLKFFACPTCGGPDPQDLDVNLVKGVFRENKIRYVAVHRLTPNGWLVGAGEDRAETYLRDVLRFTLIYEEPAFSVYRNDSYTELAPR